MPGTRPRPPRRPHGRRGARAQFRRVRTTAQGSCWSFDFSPGWIRGSLHGLLGPTPTGLPACLREPFGPEQGLPAVAGGHCMFGRCRIPVGEAISPATRRGLRFLLPEIRLLGDASSPDIGCTYKGSVSLKSTLAPGRCHAHWRGGARRRFEDGSSAISTGS